METGDPIMDRTVPQLGFTVLGIPAPVTVGGISASVPVAVAGIAVQAALAMWAAVHRFQESVACTSSGISS